MTVQLAPPLVFQSILSNGAPNAFGFVFTYIAGTATPQATWPDSTQGTPNPNPIPLNAFGQASIWLAQNLVYKIIVQDPLGNQIGFQDQVAGGVFASPIGTSIIPTPTNTLTLGNATNSWANVYVGDEAAPIFDPVSGNVGFYDETAAEIAAGVTPTNFAYPPGDVRRYGGLVGGSATANTTALQASVNVAAQSNGVNATLPFAGTYAINGSITIAAGQAVNIQGAGKYQTIIYATGFAANVPIFIYAGTTASRIQSVFLRDLWLWSDNGNADGIHAKWLIYSDLSSLNLYNLKNGYTGYYSFVNGFRNNSAFGITGDCYQFNAACSSCFFDKTRIVGQNGINITGAGDGGVNAANDVDTVSLVGCDIEGILSGGSAILIAPITTTKVHNVSVIGTHFENVNGTAIKCNGADAASLHGLYVKNNYITGGFSGYSNANAVNAIQLYNVNGFEFTCNDIIDWQTNCFLTNGSEQNGLIANNPTPVTNLVNVTGFKSSVQFYNNGAGPAATFGPSNQAVITYSASMVVNAALVGPQTEGIFTINATTGAAFTINNPTNSTGAQVITFRVANTSGGVLGAVTWGTNYRLAGAWTSPMTANAREITFWYDVVNSTWNEKTRTAADQAYP